MGVLADRVALAVRARVCLCLGVLGVCLAAGQMALAQEASADPESADLGSVEPVESAPAAGAGLYGPTTRDDTLWSIARKVRPEGLTLAETVAALQRMNQEAFLEGDPNRLMRGVMLKVPTTAATTVAETETPTAVETRQPDTPPEQEPPPEWGETLAEDVEPVPEAGSETPEMLAFKNADLEVRLEVVQTELDVATDKIGALEAQISTMRRRLAESEEQLADAQSRAANGAGPARWNAVTGVVMAVLLVAVIVLLYMRIRSGGQGAASPSPRPIGARRIASGRMTPDADPGQYLSSTKLNLARAFVDMGRNEQAREVLGEVLAEGNEDERREAKHLLEKME